MNRSTADKGLALVIEFEGEILKVYDDGFGYPTAGVGHLLTPAEKRSMPIGTRITRQQSRSWLKQDIHEAEAAVNSSITVPITQNQFDAMVSLAFNIGVAGFKRSSVVRNLNARHFAKAADSFLSWNKVKGKPVKGLTRRRNAERNLFLTPDSAANPATVTPQQDTDENTASPTNPQDNSQPSVTNAPDPSTEQNVAVVKEEKLGFWQTLKVKITAAFTGIGGATGLTSYAQQAQTFGLSSLFWERVFFIIIIGLVGWILIETVRWFFTVWQKRKRTNTLVAANATPNNSVTVIRPEEIDKYQSDGWVVVHRN
jgi:lysozyme